ncbi:MAG: aminopeptidase [Ignavibacteriaceae bacterium]|jgi:leucyl aminopeptidase (aminopeptidase T)|nr:aminopeptidase [Ignavibacteriaceae bacterium]
MNNADKILNSAYHALKQLFVISSNDKVLVLTDTHCSSIGNAFIQACSKIGSEVETYEIKEQSRPLKEPPEELIKLLSGKSIVLNIFKAYSEEIPFRIKWIFKVEENKLIKMGHMPGITEAMMLGSVNVNYMEMQNSAELLLKFLTDAKQIHITTDEGTDFYLGVKGRPFVSDVGVIKGGEMSNLPCGEIYCAPLETEANGVVVFNASVGDIGILDIPLKAYLKNGRVMEFESEDNNLVNRITELQNVDEDSMLIGELGIGINPKACITGNMLEDEKALGTAHLAFGNNADFPGGGNNNSKIHRDYLFYRPTIEVVYNNESCRKIMDNGMLI